ncbi:MAG: anaerobic ribonucleoside-triphosphate reductase activating protein [Actinobacteria bacterium]|jgi:pyruvate formate lyase activating enzyme|nr:MAG: anaerobic ribonucleoside-triphosphate reductase activating protein [Actinomycetota bacterium]
MSCLEKMVAVLPSSMLDWPGKICSVIFIAGCNFRCPYCHNPELLEAGGIGDAIVWDDLAIYLSERKGWIDGVSITGGEPTIHDDLPHLCERLRDLGMEVKLDTNGSRPRLLAEMLARGLLDFVAMDLKTSLTRYPEVARRPVDPLSIGESIDAIIGSGVEHEFRCTMVPGLVGLEDLESLAERAADARVFVLQQFRSENTLDPAYSGARGYPEETLLEWAERLGRLVPTQVRGLVGTSR